MSDDAIVTDRVVVRYRGKAALDGLDLRVPRGAVFAFLGDNGAGKTTTMKILTGLAPADTGRATILGLDCWSRATELRHLVGYVPERPRFYDWMTVAEIGWFTGSFHRPGFLARFREWTDRLGLDPAKKLRDLSKGGYARVGLALALAPDPEVLLLDEPTSGLDLLTRREFLAGLTELAAAGRTVLISSHSIAELERACTHVGLLRDGQMILSAPLDELRRKVRRFSLRFAEQPPDAAPLGTVLERNGTGRFWQALVQDPDPVAVAALRAAPGVSDFEDSQATLEEVYAALMARGATGGPATGGIPMVRKVGPG
ncbi:abc transporter atp-binding protein : ABC-type multidrug transport system, ATPase component OS=Singulisphaera acidiphila (strain ATCC BAA-1392 / DSM 18658 / VKM B-2454 / MOB10) GN=Sinac_3324 PE=3 SV=1: ABC_tran [Gemmataceae bacterium]|nr:abc transporter atp-binding protein : ABC-type multidrug transport system, ATPase component OS=Singulisphaera acidiphila (strain ATCC BAA-1392 / DSM 18658 / VKM B-2454 / MOB10) GN=Sinac_3324 PE=3 SV=1: ABC_tran [Gemmataceae bacterium]VTT97329.1 abc transporter atp-binding protein : ABC-type multidrug transport system, ATPase component OS=Singulisphaera acidiphila (strain ATCC BAA-1392 / DSM 18658 / VKM B-2454 / MOB10) GN=Sinac_3324 PE=3 SV=1: ABC_tran [Gemmataceae bacterium]